MADTASPAEFIIDRPRIVYKAQGRSRSSWYEDIAKGLMVPTCAIGGRAKGVFRHEWQTITKARMAGKTDDEIRELVRQLIAERKAAA